VSDPTSTPAGTSRFEVLQGILESSRDFIGALDRQGRFLAFNRAFQQEFQRLFDHEVKLGDSLAEATARRPEEQAKLQPVFLRALAGEDFSVVESYARTDGTRAWYEIHAGPLRDAGGQLTGTTFIAREVTQRVQAEEELRRKEERYRSIFDNVSEGVFQTTPEGHYLTANDALARIYGYANAAALLAAVKDISHQIYVQEERRADFKRLMQENDVISDFESEVRCQDGSTKWISENAHAVRDQAGQLLYYEGTVQNITQRKKFEQALRDSEVLYHSLVESLPLSIFRKDPEGRFTFGNRRFCELMGHPLEELVGKTDFDFFPREMAEKYRQDDEELMRTRKTVDTVEANKQSDGRVHHVHTVKTPLYDSAGRVLGVLGMFWDVTERRRIEEALEHERDLLRALLDSVPDRIYFKDTQSRFIRCSRALAERLGFDDPDQLIGKTDFHLHPQEIAQEFYNDEQRIVQTGVPLINKVEHQQAPGRPDAWASVTKVPIVNKSGEVTGLVGISRDITDLKNIEGELQEARDAALELAQQKSQFLATMSHEIRTPMNGIIGMIGLMLDTRLTNKQRDYLETTRQSAETLLTIINDILDFSKLEAGKLVFEALAFDLRDTIETTVELLAGRAQEKGLELITHIPAATATAVRGDPGRLRQVLTNLVGNAIKFTEQGEVLVRIVQQSETATALTVRVLVSDTGIGVSPEAQARIFQSFTQADGSMARRYGGTGLGLSISKQLIESMGGQIGVESEPGQGSTFWFEVTLEKQSPAPAPRAAPLEGIPVLLITQQGALRQFLAQDLAGLGAVARTAANLDGALQEMSAAAHEGRPVRAVLVDLDLSAGDGELIRALTKPATAGRAVPVISLVPQGGEIEGTALHVKGIAATLAKPVRQRRLVACLRSVILGDPGESTDAAREGEGAPAETSASKSLRILLAEDNAVNRKVALQQLEKLGHKADTAENGHEVLAAAGRKHYDVILMDCQMPELDGFQATREIRRREAAHPGGHRAYIVAMTANALVGDREQCLGAGMDDYLDKPVQIQKLRAALTRGREHIQTQTLPGLAPPPVAAGPVDFTMLRDLAGVAEPGSGGGAQHSSSPPSAAVTAAIELIDLYLSDAPMQIERMAAALAAGDRDKFRLAAHTLKGSSTNLGARPLAALCLEVENQARTSDPLLDSNLLKPLTAEFERVKTALEAERAAWLSHN
jgi:two-component system sensor histidine kinase/response regulator